MRIQQHPAPASSGVLHVIAAAIQSITGPWTRENLFSWVKLIVLVLTVWWIGIQPFRIPSGSMEPTLHGDPGFFVGDRVFVNKWIYGPRVPFTNTRIFRLGEPKRWDIVVFRSVEADDPRKILIKRVVGLPGERIHIKSGTLYVNGEPQKLPESMPDVYYVGEEPPIEQTVQAILAEKPSDPQTAIRQAQEIYNRSMQMRARGLLKYGVMEDDQYALIPPDHYLMMGDNSANSQDGRYFGFVPHDHLLGRAFCIWWPFGHWRDLSGFTDTAVGLLLLIGIPGVLIGYEVCRAFFFLPWRVRGNALASHVRSGEHVLINRAVFGVRLPILPIRVYPGRAPVRGEAIAYTVAPDGASQQELVFGCVAGLPGDKVGTENGLITVNGTATGFAVVRNGKESSEKNKLFSKKGAAIPEGNYLILASDESSAPDSRSLGWIPREAMVGTVSAIWWPPARVRRVGS